MIIEAIQATELSLMSWMEKQAKECENVERERERQREIDIYRYNINIYLRINNNRQQKSVLLIGHNSQRQTKNYIGTVLAY